uniref:non-specific serine/threonine protein kinase n=1 Tax=Caenorhabditis tropicalis TaxID=1561998 RepID=A0A1I7U6Y3_9PELO
MPASRSLRLRSQIGRKVFDAYELLELVSFGSYGAVYRGFAATCEVAVKLSDDKEASQNESEILLLLQGLPNVPQWLCYGEENSHHIIVMSLAFRDIDAMRQLNDSSGFRFCNETVQKILYQSVTVLESIHNRNIVHRDVKENNLMISLPVGRSNTIRVLVVDFGLATEFKDEDGKLIDEEDNSKFRRLVHSTPNVLLGLDHSRYDDLIQLSYAAISMSNDPMGQFFLPDKKSLDYKQALVSLKKLELRKKQFFSFAIRLPCFLRFSNDWYRSSWLFVSKMSWLSATMKFAKEFKTLFLVETRMESSNWSTSLEL